MKIGTMILSFDSVINGKKVGDMTELEITDIARKWMDNGKVDKIVVSHNGKVEFEFNKKGK